ncbi:MAG TPA: alpha-amylase family glycosyl hydrolase [Candidatus Limnocylindrales bacterium]|nr:alpha-amylase family glycosyl hydrolase [Candidatus Limnocylindrales bacterium]
MTPTDDWWRHGVIYQVYPRSFADSDGDGTGDLRGLISRLDHLNDGTPDSLGVDAIWLSPIYPSPGRDLGYDVSDHTTVDPLFGSLDVFDELVRECHRRGIRVVLDLVMNHTSDEHPWFRASRSSREDPKRDWYIWRSATAGRNYPNNWRSFFGGSAWEWDAPTGQFYLHTFLREQPDLNWRNPEVVTAMLEMVRGWLERGVDGFRLDVFNAFYKHADLPDNPRRLAWRAYDRQHHVHDKNRPELFDFLRRFRSLLDEKPGRMSVGELFGGTPRDAAAYSGQAADRLHMVFNFRFLQQPWRPAAIQRTVLEWEQVLRGEWPCWVLGNHDQPRLVTRYAGGRPAAEQDAVAKVAATLLLTLRGTPFIYYGEEIGMQDARVPRSRMRDTPATRFSRIAGFPSRDPCRSPMQWDDSPAAGFTAGEPWLPFAADHATRNVARQAADPGSVLSWYRRLIWARRASPALHEGTFRPLLRRPTAVMAYLREAAGQRVLVALNFSAGTARLELDEPLGGTWTACLGTHAESGDSRLRGGRRLELAPYEALLLEEQS